MAVVREVSRGLGRGFQAIVRKGGYSLSRVHGTRKNAAEWAGRVEAAIAASGPDKPFDRAAWLPSTGQQESLAVLDESCPHGGWTVSKALEHYGETLAQAKKGYAVESVRIRMWQTSAIAGTRLDALTLDDIQAVVAARLVGRAGDTVRRETNVLRALYRDAGKVWRIKGLPDPFKGLELPSPAEHRERRLQDGHGDELGEEDRLRAALATWKQKPDVADRDPELRERREELEIRNEYTAARAADAITSDTAAREAFKNRSPGTWIRNVVLGSPTALQQKTIDAAHYAERNENTRPDDGTLRTARDRGRLLALGARDRTAVWEARPDVAQAQEQARLNEAVDTAAHENDQTITRLLRTGDPDGARQIILDREEIERRAAAELERRRGVQPTDGTTRLGSKFPR